MPEHCCSFERTIAEKQIAGELPGASIHAQSFGDFTNCPMGLTPALGSKMGEATVNHHRVGLPFGRAIPNELRLQEQRQERRHSLLLRTAKFIADGSEFLCIIRDVSGAGVRLQLFHPLPHASSFVLEMPKGDRHPIRLVWSEGEFAGFQFLEGTDGSQFIHALTDENSRKYIRLQNRLPATLKTDGKILPISLVDISQQGACIECDHRLALDQLVIVDTGLLPPTFAKVRWRKLPHYGVIFEQVYRFEDLARRLAASVKGDRDDMAER